MAEEVRAPYVLKYPILLKSGDGVETSVTEVTLGRMKAKHIKLLPPGFGDAATPIEPAVMLPLVAALSNLSIEIVEELDMEDLLTLVEGIGDFLGANRSPQIGSK